MNRLANYTGVRPLLMALLLGALAAGCGGGSGGRDPILGTGGAQSILVVPAGAIIPGAACPVAGPTRPTVTATDPTDGNQFVLKCGMPRRVRY